MTKNIFTAIAGAMIALSSVPAFAQSLKLGAPGYGGNGCPAGSASVTVSPDQSAVSILFDQYIVEAGGPTGRVIDRKSCNLAVPVQIPQGWSFSIFQVDYRGYAAVPAQGRAQFTADYFFAGYPAARSVKRFNGPTNRAYELTDRLGVEALVWSPCGASTNLRVNTNMLVQTNQAMQQALATVDSADITSGIVYHIQWRRCN